MTQRTRFEKYTLVFLLWVWLFTPAFSQDVKQYEGPYAIEDTLVGEASFDFILSQRDTLFHRSFLFTSSKPDTVEQGVVFGKEFEGKYNRGTKNGKWVFRSKTFKPTEKPYINGYEIANRVNGKEYFIEGNFDDGKAQGKWQVVEHTIQNSEPRDTLFFTRTSYQNGKIFGTVEGTSNGISFKGKVNRDELLDGEWEFFHTVEGETIREVRVYNAGIFTNHFFEVDGQKLMIKHIGFDSTMDEDDDSEVWEEIAVSTKYFSIIYNTNFGIEAENGDAITISNDSTNHFIKRSNHTLRDALFAFANYEEKKIWEILPGSEPFESARLKVRKFPFSKEEKKTIENTEKLLAKSSEIINGYYNDPQVDVGKHAYRDVMFFYEVIGIYKYHTKKLDEIVALFLNPAFEYINREEIYPHIIPDMDYPDSIRYEFQDSSYVERFDFPEPLDKENCNLEVVYKHLDKIHADLVEIEKKANKKLEKYKKQTKLKEQEDRLVRKRDTIYELFSNEKELEDFNDFHKRYSRQVRDLTEDEFRSYASLTLEEKVENIDNLLSCFNDIINLYKGLADLPRKRKRLDDRYTREVWSPVTLTNMEERIKERLYVAYDEYLFPALLNELENNLSCDKIKAKTENIELMYKRMVALREQDTKDLERQLRRARGLSLDQLNEIIDLKLNLE